MRKIVSWAQSIAYNIKCWFKPYNVVKCHDLPATWVDRDNLMFHTMFQILVDFVELEQPFKPFDDNKDRYTDIPAMRAWIERHYNTKEGRESMYGDWYSEEDKAQQDKSTHKTYLIYSEILYLYEWYKNKKYDLDEIAIHEQTGFDIKFDGGRIKNVPSGKPALITNLECFQIIEEHKIICNRMLYRILQIRENLWT